MDARSPVTLDALPERRVALERGHGPWRPRTLWQALTEVAGQHPDRAYVVTDEQELTYAELVDRAEALARGLVAFGVRPGEHVAIVLPNGTAAIAVRYAVARAAAVAVPLNPRLTARELTYVLGQSRAVAAVVGDGSAPLADTGSSSVGGEPLPALRLLVTDPAAGAPSGAMSLADLARPPEAALDADLDRRCVQVRPDQTATVFYTSGSTGEPKGVLSTHDMELRSAYGSAYTRGFEDGRRILFALPLSHVFAYIEGMLAVQFVGGAVIVQAAFDPKASLHAIQRHRAGEALFVPTMSLAVIDAARGGGYDVSSLHSVMSAAASAPARLWHELGDLLGLEQLVTAYGMTETSAATTFTQPGDPVDDLVDTVGRAKDGGVAGSPELGGALVEYRTVDPLDGSPLPAGADGELVARGPIVGGEYLDKPAETAAAVLAGGWLRSGDLGRVRADGYLQLTGRSKDLYKRGGELVAPLEVEGRLNSRPDVAQAYVVGVPDEHWGEVGCAWVVPAEGRQPDPDELVEFCRAEVAHFKVPAYVLLISAAELPLTGSGKVQKFRLAEWAGQRLGLDG